MTNKCQKFQKTKPLGFAYDFHDVMLKSWICKFH